MKKQHLVVVLVAVAAAIALYFAFGRGGSGGSGAPSESAQKPVTSGAARQQVELQRSNEGSSVDALIDDDPVGTLRLEGQVIDSTEDGVAGALVTISSNPPRQTKTEPDGSFYFDKLVGRPYELVARAPGGVAGPVTTRVSKETEPVILRLRPAAAVEVTVVAASGRAPISGAAVELRDLEQQTATTGDDGVARLTNVVPGGYQLVASAPGYAPSHTWIRVPAGEVTATTTLELRRGSPVSGRVVTPGGDPVKGARVVYSGASDWAQQADPRHDAVLSDDKGEFRFPALSAGTFRFVARHEAHAPGQSELVTLDGMTEKSGVAIRLEEGAAVTGVVKSLDGALVPAARVRVAIQVAGMRWDQPRQVFTDEAGEFVIRGLPRKPVQLVAITDDAASNTVDADLTGKDAEHVTLTLDVTGRIAGVVVDSAGEPIEGAQVVAWPSMRGREGRRAARRDMQLRGWTQELTDSGGAFVITGLEPESEYSLRASPPGVSGGGWGRTMIREPVDAKTGDLDVRIVLPADGGVKGKVAFADGTVPDMFTVDVGMRSNTPFSTKDGSFELGDLPPQTYSVSITGPGFDRKEVPNVIVKEGEVADVGNVVVTKGRSVTGRVTSAGAPVAGATVMAGRQIFGNGSSSNAQFGPFGGRTKTAETDENGAFAIYGVGLGDLSLVAEHEEKGRSKAVAIRGSRDSINGLELALEPYGALTGMVKTGDGKPAENVRIGAQSQTVPSITYGVASGPDGKFRFDRLAPDTYKVSALGGGGMMRGMGFYSKIVAVASGQTATVNLALETGDITLNVALKGQNKDVGFAFIRYVQGTITPTTARDLELMVAQVGEGSSGLSFFMRGGPAEVPELEPGVYTVCAVPFPTEVQGMGDTMAYSDREGDNLPVFCKVVTVATQPAEQAVEIAVQVPAFVPLPGEGQ